MERLISSFEINGQFTEEDISSHFVNPEQSVIDMIMVCTNMSFRKACLLAILDNNEYDVLKRVLRNSDLLVELQSILKENVLLLKREDERLRIETEEFLQNPKNWENRSDAEINALKYLQDHYDEYLQEPTIAEFLKITERSVLRATKDSEVGNSK